MYISGQGGSSPIKSVDAMPRSPHLPRICEKGTFARHREVGNRLKDRIVGIARKLSGVKEANVSFVDGKPKDIIEVMSINLLLSSEDDGEIIVQEVVPSNIKETLRRSPNAICPYSAKQVSGVTTPTHDKI